MRTGTNTTVSKSYFIGIFDLRGFIRFHTRGISLREIVPYRANKRANTA